MSRKRATGAKNKEQLGTDMGIFPLDQYHECKWGYHIHFLYWQREEVRAEVTSSTMYQFWSLHRSQVECRVKVLWKAIVFSILYFKDFSFPFSYPHGISGSCIQCDIQPFIRGFVNPFCYGLHSVSKSWSPRNWVHGWTPNLNWANKFILRGF